MKTEGISELLVQIRDALSRNKLKKIIALILSIALWVYVMGAQNPVIEDSYRVKVNLQNTIHDYKAFYEDQTARVTLSAPRSYFIDYTENDILASINIAGYGEGEFDIPIEASYPKGFELINISPKSIRVKIEPIIERQMELQIMSTGSPKINSIVRYIDAPKNVAVVGSRSEVDGVNKVVGYVGIAGESDDFELNVPLTAVDENGREILNVRVVPSAVNVFVDIEKGAKKIVPIVADVTAPSDREISKITLSPDTVEIEGVEDVINSIESLKTDSVTLPAGQEIYKNYFNLIIPEGVVKTGLERVFVTVELKPTTNPSTSD